MKKKSFKVLIFRLHFIWTHTIHNRVLIKKVFPWFLLFILFFLLPEVSSADQSCCSTQGGEFYCDYSTSKLYCKDGTVSTDCTCRPADTPTPTLAPTFTPAPTPTPQACPDFSSYDNSSGVCKCNTGYVVNNNTCISYTEYCWTEYGGNAIYDTDKNSCSCSQGYTWNNEGTSCISMNDLCHNKIGGQSYFNGDSNTCNCYDGYAIQNDQCKLIPTQMLSNPQSTSETVITNTPIPSPTAAVIKIPSTSPTKMVIKSVKPTPLKKKNTQVKKYISVKKTHQSRLAQFFENIWNFIVNFI